MSITVSLLGTPRVVMNGQPMTFPYRKAEGLFYYLCVKKTVSRDEAIGIFWADCSESAARKNLRDAIYNLRKLCGENVIRVEGNNQLTLCREEIESIDVDGLTQENFFDLYTGPFLGYFYIRNCMEFEDWSTGLREELQRRYQRAAGERVAMLVQRGEIPALADCAAELLRRRVYEEGLYQEILEGLVRLGGWSEAEQLYQKLKTVLREELGVQPDEKTEQLMREAALMKADRPEKPARAGQGDYFFGREQELMALLNNLRSFERGGPAVSVLLTGEAGVGKSAILRQLKGALKPDRFVTISYQCVQTEEELYLKPWNDILAQVKSICRAYRIPMNASPDFYSKQLDVSLFATQYELYAESALQNLAERLDGRRIVVFIDDIQWMDGASKRLLSNLLSWSKNQKLLTILASRDDCGERLMSLKAPLISRGLLREVVIPRFTLKETEAIIRERRPALLEQRGLLERVYHRTDGNALFLIEFLRELEHGGNASQISEKTTGMIQSRLMDLSPEERELLDHISLNPRLATLEELRVLSTRTPFQILKDLERLMERQLICVVTTYNKRGYGFSHQLIRDYIYNGLLEDKRRMLHSLVAEDYERRYRQTGDITLCPMLIYHFSRCENVYKTYTYRLEYLRAFYATQHDIYPTVLTGEAEFDAPVRPLSGQDELVNLAEQIRALHRQAPEVDPLRMKAEFIIGRYDLFSGSFEKGLKNIQTSIALAKKLGDGKYLLENYLQMIFHAIQIHNLEMFHTYLDACGELLERFSYSEAEICTVLRLRGVFHMKNNQYDEAEEIFREVLQRIEPLCRADPSYRVGMAACYNYIGEGRQARGELDEALEYYLKAIECCEGESVVSGLGVFYSNACDVLYRKGDFDQAQAYIDKANRCLTELGGMWGRSKANSYAALLAIQRGEWEKARENYRVAREGAQRTGNPAALSLLREVERQLEKAPGGL